ncbi:MAG: winged helix-turn-helix domain-containing protein [Candidatus Diapherotrites archaeon]|nr:winged helix-turn-helix domain-containing protein [Candidatus Diapherotrites archaeon]
MDGRITLSVNEFKALASDTRASIIKLLQERNHTLSELSKKLSLAAPTVKQHLSILEGAEIIQGLEEGRKWKYYSLTKKGKNIFSPEQSANILVVLCTSIIALGAAIYWFVLTLGFQARDFAGAGSRLLQAPANALPDAGSATAGAAETAAGATIQKAGETAFAVSIGGAPLETVLALLALVVFLALLAGFAVGKLKR